MMFVLPSYCDRTQVDVETVKSAVIRIVATHDINKTCYGSLKKFSRHFKLRLRFDCVPFISERLGKVHNDSRTGQELRSYKMQLPD